MSIYERKRIPFECAICGKIIDQTAPFRLLKMKIGRSRKYVAMHRICYNFIVNDSKEITIENETC